MKYAKMKAPKSAYGAQTRTTAEVSMCDADDLTMLPVREHPSTHGFYGKESWPEHKGSIAAVSRSRNAHAPAPKKKGSRSAY